MSSVTRAVFGLFVFLLLACVIPGGTNYKPRCHTRDTQKPLDVACTLSAILDSEITSVTVYSSSQSFLKIRIR